MEIDKQLEDICEEVPNGVTCVPFNPNFLKQSYTNFSQKRGEPLRDKVCPENNEKYNDFFKSSVIKR